MLRDAKGQHDGPWGWVSECLPLTHSCIATTPCVESWS